MSKGLSARKKDAEASFAAACEEGDTPEGVVLKVMRGSSEVTARQYNAAKDLLPYRLPRLNAVDAIQRNVEMTHEEWINSIDDGEE